MCISACNIEKKLGMRLQFLHVSLLVRSKGVVYVPSEVNANVGDLHDWFINVEQTMNQTTLRLVKQEVRPEVSQEV